MWGCEHLRQNFVMNDKTPDISCFKYSVDLDQLSFKLTRSRGYMFSMLNSIEHEIYYAHKC